MLFKRKILNCQGVRVLGEFKSIFYVSVVVLKHYFSPPGGRINEVSLSENDKYDTANAVAKYLG